MSAISGFGENAYTVFTDEKNYKHLAKFFLSWAELLPHLNSDVKEVVEKFSQELKSFGNVITVLGTPGALMKDGAVVIDSKKSLQDRVISSGKFFQTAYKTYEIAGKWFPGIQIVGLAPIKQVLPPVAVALGAYDVYSESCGLYDLLYSFQSDPSTLSSSTSSPSEQSKKIAKVLDVATKVGVLALAVLTIIPLVFPAVVVAPIVMPALGAFTMTIAIFNMIFKKMHGIEK